MKRGDIRVEEHRSHENELCTELKIVLSYSKKPDIRLGIYTDMFPQSQVIGVCQLADYQLMKE